MTVDTFISNVVINDLLMIEAQYTRNEEWILVYQNDSFIANTGLSYRKFTTYTSSKDKFRVCISLKLGHKTLKMQQLRFKFRWLDCRKNMIYQAPNLQVFLHGWGSIKKATYKIPLAQVPQVFQLAQETVLTLPSKGKECSFFESGSLDECLEQNALCYANYKANCTEKQQR